jgi:hypothetical protein
MFKELYIIPVSQRTLSSKKCFLQSTRLIKDSNIYTIEKPPKNNDYLYFMARKTVALLQQSVENSSCQEAGTTE